MEYLTKTIFSIKRPIYREEKISYTYIQTYINTIYFI